VTSDLALAAAKEALKRAVLAISPKSGLRIRLAMRLWATAL
jgi:hypothetical protein